MADEGKVPVRESVGAALRFLRENVAVIVLVAGIGAAALGLLTLLATRQPATAMLVSLASTFVGALVYAALTGAALTGSGAMAQRVFADGGRVWASMAVVGFFLLIVFVVLVIPGFIALGVLLAPRYGAELQAVQGDQAASVVLMERIVVENPGMLLGFALFYGVIWLALTSRLFLAAPASVDQKRILTFETWAWTKNNTFRILGARLLLLAPAYVLTFALSYIVGRALGFDLTNPDSIVIFSQHNAVLYAVVTFISAFLQIALFRTLEAGLSAYLYRGLKPADPARAS